MFLKDNLSLFLKDNFHLNCCQFQELVYATICRAQTIFSIFTKDDRSMPPQASLRSGKKPHRCSEGFSQKKGALELETSGFKLKIKIKKRYRDGPRAVELKTSGF